MSGEATGQEKMPNETLGNLGIFKFVIRKLHFGTLRLSQPSMRGPVVTSLAAQRYLWNSSSSALL